LIEGVVSSNGVPVVEFEIEGRRWRAVVDTGFNGDLELPNALRGPLRAQYAGRVTSKLAANQVIEEDVYLVDFQFDGVELRAAATFVDDEEILIGTRLLASHRLHVDFPAGVVVIERATQ
jgi:predicted aspartyl protease